MGAVKVGEAAQVSGPFCFEPMLTQTKVAALTALQEEIVSDLLCRWHQWQQSKLHTGRGFASRSLVCGEFRVSRQYDLENGALDAAVDNTTMKAVDFAVTQMVDPWKAALYAQARALVSGVQVWSSPRLPTDPEERAGVVVYARAMLVRRLVNAGVM